MGLYYVGLGGSDVLISIRAIPSIFASAYLWAFSSNYTGRFLGCKRSQMV